MLLPVTLTSPSPVRARRGAWIETKAGFGWLPQAAWVRARRGAWIETAAPGIYAHCSGQRHRAGCFLLLRYGDQERRLIAFASIQILAEWEPSPWTAQFQ